MEEFKVIDIQKSRNLPYFEKYSLTLLADGELIYSSKSSGLRPLLDCILKIKKEHPKIRGCTLYDRAVGLAAAKLVVHSGFISRVNARIASIKAIDFLEKKEKREKREEKEKKEKKKELIITAESVVDSILKKDRSGICPMELLAAEIESPDDFFEELRRRFKNE